LSKFEISPKLKQLVVELRIDSMSTEQIIDVAYSLGFQYGNKHWLTQPLVFVQRVIEVRNLTSIFR
jgi:hypothetical protein